MTHEAVVDREAQEQVAAHVATQAMWDPMRVPPHNPLAPTTDKLSVVHLKPPSPPGTLYPNTRENADVARASLTRIDKIWLDPTGGRGPIATTAPAAQSAIHSLRHRLRTPYQIDGCQSERGQDPSQG